MTRRYSVIIPAILFIGIVCASCQGAGVRDDSSFKIGFPFISASTDPTILSIIANVRDVVEAAGGQFIIVDSNMTADNLINNITDLISQGVDGIVLMPALDSMLPIVDKMCSDAGVYYSTMFRAINNDMIREEIHKSEYFAGSTFEDDEECAYNIAVSMHDMGVKNLFAINIARGDSSSDRRDRGINRAVQDTGMNLLGTTYGISTPSDMEKTIESCVSAYPELDGILIAGTYCDAALPTIQAVLSDKGKAGAIIVGRIDYDFTMGLYLEAGTFHVAYGGQQQIDPLLSAVILVNKVLGTPIDDGGASVNLTIKYHQLTSANEAELYLDSFLVNRAIFNHEEIQNTLLKSNNANLSEAYLKRLVENFTIE